MLTTNTPNASFSLCDSVEACVAHFFSAHENHLPECGLYNRIIIEIERTLFNHTLKSVNGNQLKAAKILGINRNTLRKKLLQYGLK